MQLRGLVCRGLGPDLDCSVSPVTLLVGRSAPRVLDAIPLCLGGPEPVEWPTSWGVRCDFGGWHADRWLNGAHPAPQIRVGGVAVGGPRDANEVLLKRIGQVPAAALAVQRISRWRPQIDESELPHGTVATWRARAAELREELTTAESQRAVAIHESGRIDAYTERGQLLRRKRLALRVEREMLANQHVRVTKGLTTSKQAAAQPATVLLSPKLLIAAHQRVAASTARLVINSELQKRIDGEIEEHDKDRPTKGHALDTLELLIGSLREAEREAWASVYRLADHGAAQLHYDAIALQVSLLAELPTTGWRAVLVDDLDVLDPERLHRLLAWMVQLHAFGRLDNFIGVCDAPTRVPDGVRIVQIGATQ